MSAIQIIEHEHRSLAAVVHAMVYLAREIREHGTAPNFELFGAMIYYIDAFPERFHHPKEDEFLFPALRARHADAAPLIDKLESEHAAGAEKVRSLEQALARYANGGAPEFGQFIAAVESYANFEWKHMALEEQQLLPLAKAHLTAEDWRAIDDAFASHSDPLVGSGAETKYEALFRRIVNLAPAPLGVGPSPAADAKMRARR
jgi:hemerythrin-like domain-containing protein